MRKRKSRKLWLRQSGTDGYDSEEDYRRDLVGHLHYTLGGTRDAASNFQNEIRKFIERI